MCDLIALPLREHIKSNGIADDSTLSTVWNTDKSGDKVFTYYKMQLISRPTGIASLPLYDPARLHGDKQE